MITDNKQSDKIDKWHYIALKRAHTDNQKFIEIF